MSENPNAPRKRVSADERRRLLVAAALRVMRRDGVGAATTRAICAEAGMPHGAFHYCFHGKKDLYTALLATEVEVDLDDLWTSVAPGMPPEDGIRALLLAHWAAIEAAPDAQLVLYELGDLALRDPDLHDLAQWEQRAAVDKAAEAVARLTAEGGFGLVRDARAVAELVVSTLDGVARAWLRHRDDERARATLTDLAGLLATLTTPTGGTP
ncbi:TetR/AcrR family transcriptional regulator [Xylanimonas protaetiae]|uniref:TetR family transcriptional regulator n=1 Tax=Xylanimonas protaetiae TaxID=2509457 RepID=A0A4P6F5F5_9MICO|nr:TetR family transcriptional regulator [Xylanimonas protaetiae]QAY69469.1 TetR family transcriptional regulator [Xylanimonas protaetiae]